jgi:hypothetical protein
MVLAAGSILLVDRKRLPTIERLFAERAARLATLRPKR